MKTAAENVFVGEANDSPETKEKLAWMDISESLKDAMAGEAEFCGYASIDVGKLYSVYYPIDVEKAKKFHEQQYGVDDARDISGVSSFGLNVIYLDPLGELAKEGRPVFVVCTTAVSERDGITLCTMMEFGVRYGGLEFLKRVCRYQANIEVLSPTELAIGAVPQMPTKVSLAYPAKRFFYSKGKMILPVFIDHSQGAPVAVIQQANIEEIVGLMKNENKDKEPKKTAKRAAFEFPGTKGFKTGRN
jgi:hypothetical protein